MASLPPRPESPLRMPVREDRRHSPDGRDRSGDRRSARPMAPRFRNERVPDGERVYVPSRSRPDTYISSSFDSRRDGDRREYDDRNRDRDRNRDFERDRDRDRSRDRRNRERSRERDRDRDRDRSPRRRSPTRDYHSFRGHPRRPYSPLRRPARPYRRDSRSPPPRRRSSRSPPHRGRPRTRSRTRSPYPSSPSKRIRLGNHSIAASPRSRSPYKRRPSRDRSPSPARRHIERKPSLTKEPGEHEEQMPNAEHPVSDIRVPKEDAMDTTPIEQSTISVKTEEQSQPTISPPSPNVEEFILSEGLQHPVSNEHSSPVASSSQMNVERVNVEHEEMNMDTKPETKVEQAECPISLKTVIRKVDEAMDIVESPKLATVVSSHTQRSPSPKPSPVTNDHPRPLPTGPQRGWSNRSPPRGPRSHLQRSNPTPVPNSNHSSAHQFTPRGPRRGGFQSQASSSSYSPSVSGHFEKPKRLHIPRCDPKSHEPLHLVELEAEVAKLGHTKLHLATEQSTKALHRALQELDMATMDLQAAENRRIIADQQLEKAKSGTLGIDASPVETAT